VRVVSTGNGIGMGESAVPGVPASAGVGIGEGAVRVVSTGGGVGVAEGSSVALSVGAAAAAVFVVLWRIGGCQRRAFG
jgi:hypothetical protein